MRKGIPGRNTMTPFFAIIPLNARDFKIIKKRELVKNLPLWDSSALELWSLVATIGFEIRKLYKYNLNFMLKNKRLLIFYLMARFFLYTHLSILYTRS